MKLFTVIIGLVFIFSGCTTPEEHLVANNVQTGKAVIYTTADSTDLRLTPSDTLVFQDAGQPPETEVAIFVHPAKTFQTFVGIGGAVTDATAEVFATLPESKQQEFLQSYFDEGKGIGYTLIRSTIHSCDFSKESYTYVSDEDPALKTFTIDKDTKYRIPLIKKIIAAAGGTIPLYVSPWSPPAFMKSNHDMLHGGKLLPEFYSAWALYYTKFIKAYESAGIPIWGITVQNEPMAKQKWESCIYTAEDERDFLKNFLGPTMKKEGLGDKKIIVWDHNRDLINQRADVIFSDPDAARYAWGIGFHWYETWTGGEPMFNNVSQVNASYPDKNLIFTEGCNEKFDSTRYQYWPNAERYGRSMINDFNRGTVAWTDWNLLLDETGGPNHVGNFCFAPVHADTHTGQLIYTPAYYYIGHFSKFIRPNARRVSTVSSRSALLSTSFLNENGQMATIVMNQTDQSVTYKLYVDSRAIETVILPHAIQTMVY
ncbi:MAG: glycoside hydrolase family 30 protein [Saprospiraceae bacterium]